MLSQDVPSNPPYNSQAVRPLRSTRHAMVARAILAARKMAGQQFGLDLAVDPIGDMLLDLYVREHDGRTTSLTSLWAAAGVGATMARRCMMAMERRDIVRRQPDPTDGRRFFVFLTPGTARVIESGMETILQAGWRAQKDYPEWTSKPC